METAMTAGSGRIAHNSSEGIAAIVAIAGGLAAWEVVRHFGVHREAWDDPAYWQFGYPLMLATSLVLGMVWRERPWRWVMLMIATQAAWSLILATVASGVPNLWPLTLLMFVALGAPCLLLAYAGKWAADRMFRHSAQ
jgi:peptidoglycan/LPS O-acetylase OafA/YrhL